MRLKRVVLTLCMVLVAAGAVAEQRLQSIDSIRHAAGAYVRSQLGGHATSAIVTPAALDDRLRLTACGAPLGATLQQGAVMGARVTVTVSCRKAGWTVYVPVDVEVDLPVLVLLKPVSSGTHIGAADVTPETRRVAGVLSDFVPEVAALAGHHTKRPLPAGSVLLADMLAADPLVLRGQQVTLVASVGNLEVRAPGRAMSDGAPAARLRVQNLSSQRIVEGIVESADIVRVTP